MQRYAVWFGGSMLASTVSFIYMSLVAALEWVVSHDLLFTSNGNILKISLKFCLKKEQDCTIILTPDNTRLQVFWTASKSLI